MTDLEQKIVQLIANADSEWVSRRELALLLGRDTEHLTDYDMHCLKQLVERGEVEQRIEIKGAVMKKFYYRARRES